MRATELLEIYLNDRWAAAGGGVSLARPLEANNRGTAWADRLSWLAEQIAADDRTLHQLRSSLGVEGGSWKRRGAVAAEYAGRLKLNGRLLSYSPLSRVLEAEALVAGIAAKDRLWAALRRSRLSGHPSLGSFDFEELQSRAQNQMEVLRELHEEAARLAFGEPPPGDTEPV